MKKVLSLILAIALICGTVPMAFAAEKPTAEIKLYKGAEFEQDEILNTFDLTGLNKDFVLGAVLSIDSLGEGYEDKIADFELSLSEAVNAKLYGAYGAYKNYKWVALDADDNYIPLNEGKNDILANTVFSDVTVKDIETVEKFYCVFVVDSHSVESDLDVELSVVTFDENTPDSKETAAVTNESVTEKTVAAPIIPVADVKLIPGSEFEDNEIFDSFKSTFGLENVDDEFLVGAVLKADKIGNGFEDYFVDFKLSLNNDVSAKLFGNYGTYGWVAFSDDYIPFEKGSVNILESLNSYEVSVEELKDVVFYCAFLVDPDSKTAKTDVSLDLVLYDENTQSEEQCITVPKTETSDIKIAVSKDPVLPVADIKLISGSEFKDYDMFKNFKADFGFEDVEDDFIVGAILKADSFGSGFGKYFADFKLTFGDDITAKLFGNYGDFGWKEFSSDYIPFEKGSVNILEKFASYKVNVNDLKDVVFYCAFVVDETSVNKKTDVSLDLVLYDENAQTEDDYIAVPKTESSDKSIELAKEPELPVADIKMVPGKDFAQVDGFKDFAASYPDVDLNYAVGAVLSMDSVGFGYNNYNTDFKLNVSSDVNARLIGNYKGDLYSGGWAGIDDYSLTEGDHYLLTEYNNSGTDYKINMTVADIYKEIDGAFYCVLVVDPASFNETLTVSLDVVIYEEPEADDDVIYVTPGKTQTSETINTEFIGFEPATRITRSNYASFGLTNAYIRYYAIENASQLYWFANQVNSGNTEINAVLVNDITVNSELNSGSAVWTPIGSEDSPFDGEFDGNGHSISGLYVDSDSDNIGLFGVTSELAFIKNVVVLNSSFTGNKNVGGLVGNNGGIIETSYIYADVSGNANVGGICGFNNEGEANKCYCKGDMAAIGKDEGYSDAEAKEEADFESGEVAYMLGEEWGQKIGVDERPVFGGEKVYYCGDKLGYNNIPDIVIDDTVNVLDYSAMVNEALKDSNSSDMINLCDMNGDNVIDVLDCAEYEVLMSHIQ